MKKKFAILSLALTVALLLSMPALALAIESAPSVQAPDTESTLAEPTAAERFAAGREAAKASGIAYHPSTIEEREVRLKEKLSENDQDVLDEKTEEVPRQYPYTDENGVVWYAHEPIILPSAVKTGTGTVYRPTTIEEREARIKEKLGENYREVLFGKADAEHPFEHDMQYVIGPVLGDSIYTHIYQCSRAEDSNGCDYVKDIDLCTFTNQFSAYWEPAENGRHKLYDVCDLCYGAGEIWYEDCRIDDVDWCWYCVNPNSWPGPN